MLKQLFVPDSGMKELFMMPNGQRSDDRALETG